MKMNGHVKSILAKGGEWLGLLVVFGGLGSLWINTEVERRMVELMPVIAEEPVVVKLVTDVENTEQTVLRIEIKVDAFSEKFIAYLERQAE